MSVISLDDSGDSVISLDGSSEDSADTKAPSVCEVFWDLQDFPDDPAPGPEPGTCMAALDAPPADWPRMGAILAIALVVLRMVRPRR